MYSTLAVTLSLLVGVAWAQGPPRRFRPDFKNGFGGPPLGYRVGFRPGFRGPPQGHWYGPSSDWEETESTPSATVISPSTFVPITTVLATSSAPASITSSGAASSEPVATETTSSLDSGLPSVTSAATSTAESISSSSSTSTFVPPAASSSIGSATESSTSLFTSISTTSSTAPTRTPCNFLSTRFFFLLYNAASDTTPKTFFALNGTSSIRSLIPNTTESIAYSITYCSSGSNCAGKEDWYADLVDVTPFLPYYIPPTGGAVRVYLDGTLAYSLGLVFLTARDWYCEEGVADAFPVFKAVGHDEIQVPYQCGEELHLYGTGAAVPAGCESVTLQAVMIPAA